MGRRSFVRLVGVMLLFSFLSVAACSRSTSLLTNVSESEANRIVAALMISGLNARKAPGASGTMNVMINVNDMAAALVILRNRGYPRPHYAQFEQIFPGTSFTSSPTEERARYNYFISQSIEDTLGSIDGVVLARVHVVLPQKATFLEPRLPSSAGVLLKYLPSVQLDWMVPDIRRFVADSVPGLVPGRVSVVLVPEPELTLEPSERENFMMPGVYKSAAAGNKRPVMPRRHIGKASHLAATRLSSSRSSPWSFLREHASYFVIGGVILALILALLVIGIIVFLRVRTRRLLDARMEGRGQPSAAPTSPGQGTQPGAPGVPGTPSSEMTFPPDQGPVSPDAGIPGGGNSEGPVESALSEDEDEENRGGGR